MMQAVMPRASTGADRAVLNQKPDSADSSRPLQAGSSRPGSAPATTETVTARLYAEFSEFSGLSRAAVERCVAETWMCAEHLGLPVTGGLVEGIAREHLHAVVNSVPPSHRP